MTVTDTEPADGEAAFPDHPLLRLRNARKRYGGAVALDGAHLTVSGPGVVHCLAGENGSGKSTLMGILSGNIAADSAELEVGGERTSFRTPRDALAKGIAMVSQETALALDLTVAENILLGRALVRRSAGISWRATCEKARDVLARLGLNYDPRAVVRELPPDRRQMVEIARALATEARFLILDEPTSSLTGDEVGSLLGVIGELRAGQVSVLFVSHRLTEVFQVCDEVTVLRDGRTVSTGPTSDYTPTSLVAQMIGQRGGPGAVPEPAPARAASSRDPVLTVRSLSVPGAFDAVDLDVSAGEIVGLAGLVGSGRSELLETLFGLRRPAAGTIRVAGHDGAAKSPRAAMRNGVGYLPPDRKSQGLVLPMSSAGNLTMALTSAQARLKPPGRRLERRHYDEARAAMSIRAASPHDPVVTLSGGNQQKIAIGKWIVRRPSILLLDEPTRGVDVAAKAEIHQKLRELAADGTSVLVSSSEYDELLALCSRIVVLFGGRVVAGLDRAQATEVTIASLAGGHQ